MDNHGNDNGEEGMPPRQKKWYEGGPVNIRYEFNPEEIQRWKQDSHGNANGGEEEVPPREKQWYEGGPVNIRYEFNTEVIQSWKDDHKRPEYWDEQRKKKKEDRERKEAEEKRRSEEELEGITGQGEAETGNEMEGEDTQQVVESEKEGHNGTLTLEGEDASGNSVGDVSSVETDQQEVNDDLVWSEDEVRDVLMQNGGTEVGEESQQHTENSTENEMEESDQEKAVTPPEALVENVQNNEALVSSCPKRARSSSDDKEESLPKSQRCHRQVECPVCNRPGIVSRSLKAHLWTHLSVEEKQKALETKDSCVPYKAKKPYKCEQCEASFCNSSDLRKHNMSKHGSVETKEALKKLCSECGGVFVDLKQHHKWAHGGGNVYTCMDSGCGKGFKSLTDLKNHRNVHLEIRPFQCDMCTKEFTTSGNLKQHQRRVHSGLKPFKCLKCDKVFADKSYLKRHAKSCRHVEGITPKKNAIQEEDTMENEETDEI